jgi:hypothetical protein
MITKALSFGALLSSHAKPRISKSNFCTYGRRKNTMPAATPMAAKIHAAAFQSV